MFKIGNILEPIFVVS